MEQGLPKAIQAELDAAEAIQTQLAQAATSEPGNTDAEPVNQTPPDDTSVTIPEPPPAAEPQPPVDVEWKQRYDILQGKYNAEVPRLYEQLKGQGDALHKMQEELQALKTAPKTEAPKAALVTKDDEDTFGSDMIDLNRRVTRDEMSPLSTRLSTVEQTLQQLVGLYQKVTSVEQQQVQSSQERFWNALGSAVSDWEQVNADPRWLQWLNEYDPVAGRTRQESLDEATNSLDSKRVIGMFSMFKSVFMPAEPAKSNAAAKQELSRQVAPAKQSGAASQPVADKVWSMRDYEAAFDPRLYQSMPGKEVEALQAEADRALAEGRVR